MTYKYAMQMFPIKNKPDSIWVPPTNTDFDYENCIIEVADLVTPEMAKELKDYASNSEVSGLHPRQSKDSKIVANFHTCLIYNHSHKIYEILNDSWHTYAKKIHNDIVQIEPYEIKRYVEGDSFGMHYDSCISNELKISRKLNILIQLSDSDEYEGGDLEIGPYTLSRKLGTGVIFPAEFYHLVTPLTKGIRFSLIGHGWCPINI